jgi:hypothetical protein
MIMVDEERKERKAVSDDELYTGHVQQILHYSGLVNKYRTYIFASGSVLLALAGNVYFVGGFGSESILLWRRYVILVILCCATLAVTLCLHLLIEVYVRIAKYIESDLERLTEKDSRIQLWKTRQQARADMRTKERTRFHLTYFGTIWIFYLGAIALIVVATVDIFIKN